MITNFNSTFSRECECTQTSDSGRPGSGGLSIDEAVHDTMTGMRARADM